MNKFNVPDVVADVVADVVPDEARVAFATAERDPAALLGSEPRLMVAALNELTLDAEPSALEQLPIWLQAFIGMLPISIESRDTFVADLLLAVHEVAANQIDHAYKQTDKKDGDCTPKISFSIEFEPAQRAVVVRVQDHGQPLDVASIARTTWRNTIDGEHLDAVEEPTWDQERGRGLFLIFSLTNKVVYRTALGGNVWTLTKYIKPHQPQQ